MRELIAQAAQALGIKLSAWIEWRAERILTAQGMEQCSSDEWARWASAQHGAERSAILIAQRAFEA